MPCALVQSIGVDVSSPKGSLHFDRSQFGALKVIQSPRDPLFLPPPATARVVPSRPGSGR
jgi:hypothetical protein